jgi:transcriptional regulator with XRE-family HTH domain
MLKRLGKRIAMLRRNRGYSQEKLTIESGLAKGTVSRIEHGLVNPQFLTLVCIAKTLKVSLKKLCNLSIENSQEPCL